MKNAFSFFLITVFVTGCSALPKRYTELQKPEMSHIKEQVQTISKDVHRVRKSALTHTQTSFDSIQRAKESRIDLESALTSKNEATLQPTLTKLSKAHTQVKTSLTALKGVITSLETTEQNVVSLETDMKQLENKVEATVHARAQAEEQNKQLKDKERKKFEAQLNIFIMIGIGLAVFGIIIMLRGWPWGASLMIGGVCIVGLCYGVKVLDQYAWIFGGGLGGIIILILLYLCKRLFTTEVGLEETVKTGEAVKTVLTPEQRQTIFGPKGSKGLAEGEQRESTQKEVQKIKARLKSKL